MFSKVILTEDGSSSVFSSIFNASYHSMHGSIQETDHVFIDSGLKYFHNQDEISIFEMGFGTGLNMLRTYMYWETQKINVRYTGLEAYPLDSNQVKELNYLAVLEREDLKDMFSKSHSDGKYSDKNDHGYSFSFKLENTKIENYELPHREYDLIYHDGFGPSVQSFLWEEELLQRFYCSLKAQGILVSYCAKGSFKRALKNVGFRVESIPGPKGKREMTRAIKTIV